MFISNKIKIHPVENLLCHYKLFVTQTCSCIEYIIALKRQYIVLLTLYSQPYEIVVVMCNFKKLHFGVGGVRVKTAIFTDFRTNY